MRRQFYGSYMISGGKFFMNKWSKTGLSLGATALIAITLAGCGNSTSTSSNNSSSGSSGSSNTSSSANGTNSTSNSNSTTTSSSTQKPLVMLPSPYGSFQNNFNPFSNSSNPGTNGFIYQPLYYLDAVSGKSFPFLASSYSWSSDNKTLIVKLQHNAKWTDGKAFTSKDVVFTFNLLKQYPTADTAGVWQQLTNVQANGDYEVDFAFKSVNVPFASYVLGTDIVPEHVWSSLGDPTKVSLKQWIGTGPYTISKFTAQGYTFAANPDYYLGKPPVNEIEVPAYSGNDSADLALAKGQVDWGGVMIPSVQSTYAAKSPNNKFWYPPSNVVMLYTNLKDPLLSQLPVRQAISMAIDRTEISNKGEYGYTKPASATGLVLPNNQAWVDPSLSSSQTTFKYDPSGAEKVLENAGFKKNSSGVFVSPKGKPLSFTLQVVSGWSDWDASCSLIAQQLKKVGIDVKVDQVQYGAYASALKDHKYQLAMSWTNTGPTPYYLYQNMLNTNGNYNVEDYSNSTTDQILSDFSQTTDVSQQKQDIYKLEKLMIQQLPSIPVFYGPYWYDYNDSRFSGWPSSSSPYVTPTPYSWPAPAIVVMNLKPKS